MNKSSIREIYRNTFIKSAEIVIVSVGFVLYNFIFMFSKLNKSVDGVIGNLSNVFNFSFIEFIVIAFISFEVCYKIKKNNLSEILKTTKGGLKQIYSLTAFYMFFLICIYCCFIILWIAFFIIKYNEMDLSFTIQIVLNIILSFFFIPCCASVMGMALSLLFNRLNACLLIIFFSVLASPIANEISFMILESFKINIYPALSLFNIFPPDLNWTPEYSFGMSVLPYRWFITFFWFLLFISVIFFKTNNSKLNKTRAKIIFTCTLSLICVIFGMLPSSKVIKANDNPESSIWADSNYYEKNPQELKEEKNFNVISYKLRFTFLDKLYGTADLTVDKKKLSEYKFTLYHGYRIKSISDEKNNKLLFEQKGDHFTVKNQNKRNINELVIHYSGFSPIYFANIQGVNLPGFSVYYPIAGIYNIYDTECNGMCQTRLENPVMFHIKCNSLKKIYCSLGETGKNTFEGITDGVTLLSGLYREYEYDGIEVIYPYMDPVNNEKTLQNLITKNSGTDQMPNNIKKILLTPDYNNLSTYTFYCKFSNYIDVHSAADLEVSYLYQSVPSYKFSLFSTYQRYISFGDDNFREMVKMGRETYGDEFEPGIEDWFVDYLDKYGVTEGRKRIEAYLDDDSDTRGWKEFILS